MISAASCKEDTHIPTLYLFTNDAMPLSSQTITGTLAAKYSPHLCELLNRK